MSMIGQWNGYVALTLLLSAACPTWGEQVVWQIGKFDNSYAELGKIRKFEEFPAAYPNDTAFVVGKGNARTDWPFIHPGPSDAWAGAKAHAFTVEFEMADSPKGECELRLDFVDAQSQIPPRLTIQINDVKGTFSLRNGAGDLSLVDSSKGKEQTLVVPFDGDLLRKGANRITITNVAGSWALYDALALVAEARPGGGESRLHATATNLMVSTDGGVQRLAQIHVEGPAARKGGTLRISIDGKTIEHEVAGAGLGNQEVEVTFFPVEKACEVRVDLVYGPKTVSTTMKASPVKKWKVYVAQSVHTDIGYTDLQKNVIALHNRNNDTAVELTAKYPDYKWNIESSWAAQMYQRDRTPEQMKKLLALSKQRRIGIEANYLNMLTGLCSAEELTRMLYYSANLARQYGVPFESVTLTDAPSHVWSLPTILRRAGIKYLSMGINQIRAPLLRGNLDELSPVWWEGPDGSKVLSWFTDSYFQAMRAGLGGGVDVARRQLADWLKPYDQRTDYPYDAILLHGAYVDNALVDAKIAETVEAWNAKYAYPKIIQASLSDFFRYIEENFADKIPTVRGCGGSWWEDGAASSAHETAMNRNTHERVVAAEACWAGLSWLDKGLKYPHEEFSRVWDNVLLYDEHTWGAHNSIANPEVEFVTEQWRVKAAYATDADRDCRQLLEAGLSSLGKIVTGKGKGLLVYNPLSWDRTEMVRAALPVGAALAAPDGQKVSLQLLSSNGKTKQVAFLAKDVPAMGYRRYEIAEGADEGKAVPAGRQILYLDNKFYQITLDAKSGGIASIVDKEADVELVDRSSPYKVGEVIYAAGGEESQALQFNPSLPPAKYELSQPDGATWETSSRGEVMSWARSSTQNKMLPSVGLEVTLYEDIKRLDLTVHLDKKLTYRKEAVYVAFPFAADRPAFRYEVGGGWVRPNEDHLSGACFDWFSVQNSVTLTTPTAGISLSPVDTPLITLCDITPGRWLEKLPVTNGTVFAYTMNNYWFTNYKAGQDGTFAFRYSVSSGKSLDTTASTRHGWSAARPLTTMLVDKPAHPTLPSQGSFCQIDAPNVILTAFKQAEDGEGYVLRFMEVGGKATKLALGCGLLPAPSKAQRCDSVERNLATLPVADGRVSLDVASFGIETIRLMR